MSPRMSSKWSRRQDSRSPGRNRPRDSRSPGRNRARGRGSVDRGEHSRRRESGSPLRSMRSRWDSSPRVRRRELDSPARSHRKYRFDSPPRSHRSEFDSPTRSQRKDKWGSPPRPHRSDLSSPNRSLRKDFDLSPRSRRDVVDDGFRVSHGQYLKHGPAGLVFLCSTSTKRDCFQYAVFGLPLAQREIVERVVPGTKLFLYNFETKELFGVFEAASSGGLHLVPEAFRELQSSYASQVRIRLYRECLPLSGDIVKDVLRENLSERGKFDCELSADQVFKLIQLFSTSESRLQNAAPQMAAYWDSASVLSSRNAHPDAQLHLDKGDGSFFMGSKLLGDSTYHPEPAAEVGQGTIEEVDRLALKYLKNDPGFLGNRLDSLDSFLHGSSGYTRDNSHSSIHGLSVPSMNHVQRADIGNYPGIGIQPHPGSVSGVPEFPPRMLNSSSHESNMHNYLREGGGISDLMRPSGSGGSLAPLVNNGALLPMGMGTASTGERQVQATSEGNIALNAPGHFLPGALQNEKSMGLLPLPGTTGSIPPQAGRASFPFGATVSSIGSLQVTGNAAGSSEAAPLVFLPSMLLPGTSLPVWPLQAANSIPPHAINFRQPAARGIRPPVNFHNPKRVRARKKQNLSAATVPQKAAGTQESKEKLSQPDNAEPGSNDS